MSEQHQRGLVSVIIPAYDRAGSLRETLSSVLEQTYRPIEVIVVDDGSTDGTRLAAQDWSRQSALDGDFSLRCFRQEHAGAPSARNRGLRECRGEFIQFLDSDDLLHPEKIEKQVARLVRDERIDLTYAHTAYFTETADWSADPYDTFPEAGERPLTAYLLGRCWPTMSALFRRRACHAVGPWDEQARILEDWDYTIRAMLGGACLDYLDETLLLYRQDHDIRPTVTSRARSPESLRSRYALTVRWVQWIRAEGQLDRDIADAFAGQLFAVALEALLAGYVGLAREVFDTIARKQPRMQPSRSLTILARIAQMPSWCAPSVARAFERLKRARRSLRRVAAIRRGRSRQRGA